MESAATCPQIALDIGQHIQQLREARGITRKTVAYLTHVNARTYSRWELNQSRPDMIQAAVVAMSLGITLPSLYPPDLFAVIMRYVQWEKPFDLEAAINQLTVEGCPPAVHL